MNEHPIPNADQPLHGNVRRRHDQLPLRISRWTAMKALYLSWRAAHAAESAYGKARARGASRDVAANAAFKSIAGEERPTLDGGDAERVRHVVDTGHGDPPPRALGPATEMDQALGTLASRREAATTNADTYVIALCVLAFVGLALFGFYPVYSVRTGDAATAPIPVIACGQDSDPLTPSRGVKLGTACR
jgi:hypothetical protein